jgi:prepilin-type processing-associated H-X9-DG protein
MAGVPKRLRWRTGAGREVAIVGSRGPADGVAGPGSLSCTEDGTWRGAMAFGDGHVEFQRAERGRPIRFDALDATCNPFAPDGGGISFTRAIAPDGAAILQHD